LAQEDQEAYQQAAQRTAVRPEAGGSMHTFFGNTTASGNPGGFWDTLLPQPYPGQETEAFPAWGGGVSAPQGSYEHGTQPWSEQAYAADTDADMEDDGTDTDTSSDDGTEDLGVPDTTNMSEAEAAENIYMMYRRAKRAWRRFTGKPVRRFRRAIKFQKRRRKGKGKGKGFFWTHDDTLVYLKGKGKGHRANSSGKGHGRRKNPKDRQGNIMRCRICNSDEHFDALCPQKGSGKGSKGGPNTSFSGLAVHPEPQEM